MRRPAQFGCAFCAVLTAALVSVGVITNLWWFALGNVAMWLVSEATDRP